MQKLLGNVDLWYMATSEPLVFVYRLDVHFCIDPIYSHQQHFEFDQAG